MIADLRELLRRRQLLYIITLREIQIRYKQSLLGMAWAILQPLSMMVVFTIIFSRLAKIPSDGIPYPIFSYCALLPWSFFSTGVSSAIPSVVNNSELLRKIYFPREIFPCASIMAACIDFGIASSIFVLMMFFYQVQLTWNIVYVIPLMLIQIIFTLGISLFAGAVNVRYRDVKYALPLALQLWMFVTPIVYPMSIVPERFRMVYMLNPMAGLIEGYRQVILRGLPLHLGYLGLVASLAVVVFLFAYWFFKREEMNFADII